MLECIFPEALSQTFTTVIPNQGISSIVSKKKGISSKRIVTEAAKQRWLNEPTSPTKDGKNKGKKSHTIRFSCSLLLLS